MQTLGRPQPTRIRITRARSTASGLEVGGPMKRVDEARRSESASGGSEAAMRIGQNVEVRPLGGGIGCLTMLLISVVASVILTACVNLACDDPSGPKGL